MSSGRALHNLATMHYEVESKKKLSHGKGAWKKPLGLQDLDPFVTQKNTKQEGFTWMDELTQTE